MTGSIERRRSFDRRKASVQTVVSIISKQRERSFAAIAASRAILAVGRDIADDGMAGLGDLNLIVLRRGLGMGLFAYRANACGILAGEPSSICVLTYLDNIAGVRKTFGSIIMVSASFETCFAILFLVEGVRRGAKVFNDDGLGRERPKEGLDGIVSSGEPVSSDKSVDAEELCASTGVLIVSDELEIDLAKDSHFANSNCTCSSDGRSRGL